MPLPTWCYSIISWFLQGPPGFYYISNCPLIYPEEIPHEYLHGDILTKKQYIVYKWSPYSFDGKPMLSVVCSPFVVKLYFPWILLSHLVVTIFGFLYQTLILLIFAYLCCFVLFWVCLVFVWFWFCSFVCFVLFCFSSFFSPFRAYQTHANDQTVNNRDLSSFPSALSKPNTYQVPRFLKK